MGLSISRQILEKHGALIELESKPGEGTMFRVVFPIIDSLDYPRSDTPPRESSLSADEPTQALPDKP